MHIAGQLAHGVKPDFILDNIRDEFQSGISRIHLTTRKDIINIESCFGLNTVEKHRNDAVSVQLWVEELKMKDFNPVLLYKPQGDPQSTHCKGLDDQDFILVIQTPLQAEMLKKFPTIICVDSTHGTNGYDFNLITVVIVNEFGEGYPVSWCISNREDGTLLKKFLQCC